MASLEELVFQQPPTDRMAEDFAPKTAEQLAMAQQMGRYRARPFYSNRS